MGPPSRALGPASLTILGAPIAFPRDMAGELHRRLASGAWAPGSNQEADPNVAWMATGHRASGELYRPLPTESQLVQLLDTAYIASLLEEEGRRVTCAFGYVSPEAPAGLGYGTLRFATALPFTPANVAKLAPAAQPGRTELGVWTDGGLLVVWGLIHHGDRTFAIDIERKPTYLSVRILRPGTFTVNFEEQLQLLFSRDHGQFFDGRLDLLGTMRDRACVEPWVAAALCRLAQRMLAHGHGGTLLVVDKHAGRVGLVDHHALTPAARPDTYLAEAVQRDEEATSGNLSRGERRKRQKAHDEALDFVAHLTAVDGAVVFDNALGLLGAGATIQTPESAMPQEIMLENPRAIGQVARAPLSLIGGNRHRSAVCFCAQQEGAVIALVASQDGDLSYLTREPDGFVHVLRPYELGVGL